MCKHCILAMLHPRKCNPDHMMEQEGGLCSSTNHDSIGFTSTMTSRPVARPSIFSS